MAEENNNQNAGVAETKVNRTTEVVDRNTGNTVEPNSSLAAIFDKIESGKNAKEAVEEVMKPQTTTEKVAEEVKEEEGDKGTQSSTTTETQAEKTADDPRSKLEALTKTETKATETKVENKDAVTEDELQVLPHDKPKTAKRIAALLAKASEAAAEVGKTKAEKEELAKKVKEYEDKLAATTTIDPKTQEEINRQKEELSMYRRRYELDKDPEVKTKYDARIESAEGAIESTLLKYKGGDAMVKAIKEAGGWAKFASSDKRFVVGDNEETTAAKLAESVYNELPMVDRKAIDAAMFEQIQTQRERDRFIQDQSKTATEYFTKRDEEQKKQANEQQARIDAARKEIENWQKDVTEKTPWLKEKEVPATATPEEKKAISEENEFNKQLNGLLKANLNPQGLKNMLEVVFDSVRYYQERRESAKKDLVIQSQTGKIKELEDKLNKFKEAGRTTSKSGLISGGGGSGAEAPVKKPQSLEEALEVISSGGNPL